MKNIALKLGLCGLAILLAGGCASNLPRSATTEPPLEVPAKSAIDPHYEAVIQRGPEYIDALRAEPAPAQPEVVEGKSELGDQRELASKGYVRIGNARYPQVEARTMRAAIELGQAVGADRMLLYPHHPGSTDDAEADEFLVAYYVRFKLLFGATFRNLTSGERKQLDIDHGVRIGSVVGGTPASQANLMSGDYVFALDGSPVPDRGGFQKLLLQAAGKSITLKVRRGQQTVKRIVRLGAAPGVREVP
jgi:hypothetical protein